MIQSKSPLGGSFLINYFLLITSYLSPLTSSVFYYNQSHLRLFIHAIVNMQVIDAMASLVHLDVEDVRKRDAHRQQYLVQKQEQYCSSGRQAATPILIILLPLYFQNLSNLWRLCRRLWTLWEREGCKTTS